MAMPYGQIMQLAGVSIPPRPWPSPQLPPGHGQSPSPYALTLNTAADLMYGAVPTTTLPQTVKWRIFCIDVPGSCQQHAAAKRKMASAQPHCRQFPVCGNILGPHNAIEKNLLAAHGYSTAAEQRSALGVKAKASLVADSASVPGTSA